MHAFTLKKPNENCRKAASLLLAALFVGAFAISAFHYHQNTVIVKNCTLCHLKTFVQIKISIFLSLILLSLPINYFSSYHFNSKPVSQFHAYHIFPTGPPAASYSVSEFIFSNRHREKQTSQERS